MSSQISLLKPLPYLQVSGKSPSFGINRCNIEFAQNLLTLNTLLSCTETNEYIKSPIVFFSKETEMLFVNSI